MKLISGEHVGALAMSEPNGKIHIVWMKSERVCPYIHIVNALF